MILLSGNKDIDVPVDMIRDLYENMKIQFSTYQSCACSTSNSSTNICGVEEFLVQDNCIVDTNTNTNANTNNTTNLIKIEERYSVDIYANKLLTYIEVEDADHYDVCIILLYYKYTM